MTKLDIRKIPLIAFYLIFNKSSPNPAGMFKCCMPLKKDIFSLPMTQIYIGLGLICFVLEFVLDIDRYLDIHVFKTCLCMLFDSHSDE